MSFIKSIEKTNNNQILINKLTSEVLNKEIQNETLFSESIKICYLDLETTGTNKQTDKIIEIAFKILRVDKLTGALLSIEGEYMSFEDPNEDISEKIEIITGISNKMVLGHKINWASVSDHISNSDIIVAHNASFDRAFMDRYLPLSRDKIWVCSINDINWMGRGFIKSNLELLSLWHGFYYDSHRAMNDVDALIYLLSHPSYNEEKPIVELINNSLIPYYKIIAAKSPFEKKDILKSNNYYWDAQHKYWWKRINSDNINSERDWLTKNIYNGFFQGLIEEVPPKEKYK